MRRALIPLALLTAALGACASTPSSTVGLGDACVFSGPGVTVPPKAGDKVRSAFRTEWHVDGREIPVHYIDATRLRRPAAEPACGASTG